MKYELIQAKTTDITQLAKDSAFTWEGMTTDSENLEAIAYAFESELKVASESAKKNGIHFYTWTGKKMNNKYHLKGNNAYPDNLNFIAIPLSDLNGKAPIVKNQVGARWLNDIVDNNRFRNR